MSNYTQTCLAPDNNKKNTIPKDEIWEFQECFNWFDKDGDGYISGIDLPTAVRAMGQYWTFADLRQLTKEYSPSQKISFEKFLSICSKKYGLSPDLSAIERAFEVFDRERNGMVLIDDLRHVLSTVGEKLSKEEFQELCEINNIQYKGGNQSINKQEFLSLFGVNRDIQTNN